MRKIIPITRQAKFFSQREFDFEERVGREWLEGDNNMKVVLFKVNRTLTQSDDLYGEAGMDKIQYYPPVEINVLPLINKAENKTYNENNGSLRYLQDGQLTFIVYSKLLKELGAEISYGDYIGYSVDETTMRYFVVVDDGARNHDNNHTMLGYKPFYRTILCAMVGPDEFSGI